MPTVEQILNTEIPAPTFVLSPSRPAPIPSDVNFGEGATGRPTPGRTLNSATGKFESKGSDVPRIYGENQSLLVEASSRTNHLTGSSDLKVGTEWNSYGNYNRIGTAESIIEGKSAYEVETGGGNDHLNQVAGSFTGSTEIAWVIVEKKSADQFTLIIRDSASGDKLNCEYTFSGDSVSTGITGTANQTLNGRARVLTTNGLNSGTTVLLSLRYTTAGFAGNRQLQILPNTTGATARSYIHHAQLEERGQVSSPIVSGSSPTTRSGETFELPQGSWWNDNEGTFFYTFNPLNFYQAQNYHTIRNMGSGVDFGKMGSAGKAPYPIQAEDNSGRLARVDNRIQAYTLNKYAVSFDQSKMINSANGVSSSADHDGALLDTSGVISISPFRTQLTYGRIAYFPRAFSEATLNILTS